MIDVNEFDGLTLMEILDNGDRVTNSIDSGKKILIRNNRNKQEYKITLTKINGSSYKVVLDFSDDRESKEYKLLINGKICTLAFESVISMYIKNEKLYIIAAQEMDFYE